VGLQPGFISSAKIFTHKMGLLVTYQICNCIDSWKGKRYSAKFSASIVSCTIAPLYRKQHNTVQFAAVVNTEWVHMRSPTPPGESLT
jgi:hypothetical protein